MVLMSFLAAVDSSLPAKYLKSICSCKIGSSLVASLLLVAMPFVTSSVLGQGDLSRSRPTPEHLQIEHLWEGAFLPHEFRNKMEQVNK